MNPQVQFCLALIAGLMITFAIWQSFLLRQSLFLIRKEEADMSKRLSLFLGRQHRRRIQMAVMIGCAGLFMLPGIYIPIPKYAAWFVLAWILVVGFLLWTMILALFDVISINLYFAPSRRKDAAEHAKVMYQIEKEKERLKKRKQNPENDDHTNDLEKNDEK